MKELEALERLAMPDELHIKECKKLGIGLTEDYDVVEQALLELQAIKEANPSEALECLEALEQDIKDRVILAEDRQLKLCAVIKQALLKAQKEHNALEIIKKTKNIKVSFYENGSGKHYKIEFDKTRNQTITEEEFNLLKEVLE